MSHDGYNAACKICAGKYMKIYRLRPAVQKHLSATNFIRNRRPEVMVRRNNYSITYRKRQKLQALNRLGGAKCVMCGCESIQFLTIDHINKDGGGHRRTVNSGWPMQYWVKKATDQELNKAKLRVLCFNCNCSQLPDSALRVVVDSERRRIMSDERYG